MTPSDRFQAATKDNICDQLIPSDIRHLLGEISSLRGCLEEINKHPYHTVPAKDTGQHYSAVVRLNKCLDDANEALN